MTAGDKPYQLTSRQAWFANPRTDANGRVRPGAHLAAMQARIAAESARAADLAGAARPEAVPTEEGGVWNPLGPAGVGFGQADGRPRVSGRVTSIAVHPDGARAYIGTANGGTWYTDDLGRHWRSLDTYAQTAPLTGRRLGYSDALAVGAVAVAWGTDASTDVVYVGTGEPFHAFIPDSFYGVGIRVATGPATVDPLDPTKVTWTTEAPDLVGKAVYKLACDPDPTRAGVVYAATTDGLYRRGLNADGTKPEDPTAWVKVFDPPKSSVCIWLGLVANPVLVVSDVVIAPAGAGSPQTVYLAVYDARTKSDQQVWQSQSGDKDSWKPVPGYTANERTSLSVSPDDPTVVYALSSAKDPGGNSGQKAIQTILARLVNGTFQPVSDVPVNLAGQINYGQAFYDIVVAADPVDKSVVWIAGKDVAITKDNLNASVFRGEVKAGAQPGTWSFKPVPRTADPADDPAWVGAGAHPDVHAIAFSGLPTAPTVWLGCDGGVFQCLVVTVLAPPPNTRGVAASSAPGPWQQLNNGLAITQPNYLAQSPASDFLMIAGTQDNGAEERVGPAVWRLVRLGDGGGCAIDPAHPIRRFIQYNGFTWLTRAASRKEYQATLYYPSDQAGPLSDDWDKENLYASFYSHAAARVLGNGNTALIFGSHRVWYCEDWGQNPPQLAPSPDKPTWRTVPTGTNPYELKDPAGKSKPDLNQDSLQASVIRVAFASDILVLALTRAWPVDPKYKDPQPAALYQLNTTAPGQAPVRLSPPDPNRKPPPPPAGASLGFPEDEIPLGLAVDQPPGPTCYVTFGAGQNQDKDHPNFDHVWWYDGTYWWPCGFDATVADTPVNAIVVDADRTVFAGTDVGVFMGLPDTSGTAKKWTWSPLSNGLPEAPVLDLALVKNPNLLRAATHGRGVWELNLTEAKPVIETYVRAHVSDTRRVFPAPAIDPTAFGTVPARIDASPDVVITGPPNPPPPGHLPLHIEARPQYSDATRVLQFALRQRQIAAVPPSLAALRPIVVDGYFDPATQRAVKAVQTAAGLPANGKVAGADWSAVVTAPYTGAAAGTDATYLDVSLLDTICPVNGPPDGPSLVSAPTGASVYVQVNARGWQRRPAGSVTVGLLGTPNFDASLATLPALPSDWGTQFTNALTSSPATWLNGSTAWAWLSVPATTATARPLHPEEPQVVRFPVTFPVPPGAPHLPVQWTMLAIVSDPLDQPSFAGTSVYDLVLNNRHVAVRSVTLVT